MDTDVPAVRLPGRADRRIGGSYLVAGITSLLVGGFARSPCLARLGLAAIALAALAALLEPAWMVGAHLDRSGEWVILTRVHPRFAAATAALQGDQIRPVISGDG